MSDTVFDPAVPGLVADRTATCQFLNVGTSMIYLCKVINARLFC